LSALSIACRKYFDFFSGALALHGTLAPWHHGIAGITASPASRHRRHHGIAGITASPAFSPVYIQGSSKIVFLSNPDQHAQHNYIVQTLDMPNL